MSGFTSHRSASAQSTQPTPATRARSPRRLARRALAGSVAAVFLLGSGTAVAQADSSGLWFGPALPVSTAAASTASAASTESAVSADWAGWEVTGGTYTSVSASWTVRRTTCTSGSTAYSAHWVGLDGDGSESVEQIGTSSDCDAGTPGYTAWYEFYPSASVKLSEVVQPGDRMTASVTAVPDTGSSAATSTGTYRLTLTDSTRHWTRTVTGQAPLAQNASAEIISEAPSDGRSGNVLPLADFGTQTFTHVQVNGKPITALSGTRRVDLADSSGTAMATTSSLSAGSGFTVSWKSSGGDAQPAGLASGSPGSTGVSPWSDGSGSTPGLPGSTDGTTPLDNWSWWQAWAGGWPGADSSTGSSSSAPSGSTGLDQVGAAAGSADDPSSAFAWSGY